MRSCELGELGELARHHLEAVLGVVVGADLDRVAEHHLADLSAWGVGIDPQLRVARRQQVALLARRGDGRRGGHHRALHGGELGFRMEALRAQRGIGLDASVGFCAADTNGAVDVCATATRAEAVELDRQRR